MTRDDYLKTLQSLLPRGKAWTRDPDANLTKVLRVIAGAFARVDEQARLVLAEADPRSMNVSLEEWEENLGLPDNCSIADATVRTRIDAVIEKFTREGGLSIAYYVGLAEALGYTVDIEEFCPFEFGLSHCGGDDVLADDDIRFMLIVNVRDVPLLPFEFGTSSCGEALLDWTSADDLECIIRKLQPSEAIVYFNYGE